MKTVEVVFDIPLNKKFEYLVEEEPSCFVRVFVPFGNMKKTGFVVGIKNKGRKDLKKVIKVYDKNPLINSHLYDVALFVSDTFVSSTGQAIFSIVGNLPFKLPDFKIKEIEKKGKKEKKVIIFKREEEKKSYYEEIINQHIKNGSVLFILPEVETAKDYYNFLKEKFEKTVLYYGEMRKKEKGEKWAEISSTEKNLIISTRIGIFLPVCDLSAIIIEDATNQSFIEKQTPKYDTVEVAEFRSEKTDSFLYLGENCFSIREYMKVKEGEYNSVVTGKGEKYPDVYILKIRRKLMDKFLPFLTKESVSMMEEAVIRKEKVAIIHNRKGSGKILICEKCNYRFTCKNCFSFLVLSDDGKKLFCKYCKKYIDFEKKCPECGSRKISIKIYGIEKMVNTLKEIYENVKVKKYTGESKKIDDDFDIVVGTGVVEEIIGKRNIKLVIFANADYYLNLNDFAAEEKFFIMVNKFLSKAEENTKFLIQTGSPELEIFKSLKQGDLDIFYQKELRIRKQIGYPPFSKILKIEIRGTKRSPLEKKKNEVEEKLKENNLEIIYSGQSFPPVIDKKHIWKFLVKIEGKVPTSVKELIDGNFITAEINPSRI